MDEKQKEMIKKIMGAYGFEQQCEIFVEECAEAIQAMQKLKRAKNYESGMPALKNLKGEIADIIITAEQMQRFIGAEDIDKIITEKLERQIKRIEEETEI